MSVIGIDSKSFHLKVMNSQLGRTGIIDKMRLDVQVLERTVKAKHAIMAEVLGGLDDLKSCSNRQFVKSVFNVTPNMSVFPASTIQISKEDLFGLGENIVAVFCIRNKSLSNSLSVNVHILASTCSSIHCKFLNDSSEAIDIIGADSSARCIISFENQQFSKESLQLVFNAKWVHSTPGVSSALSRLYSMSKELPQPESLAVVVEEPNDWYNIADFPSFSEIEAKRVLEGCSVVMFSRHFKPISVGSFRRMFNDKFQCCDYGELQLFVGTHKFTGIIVTSSLHDYGTVNIAYANFGIYVDRFVRSLIKLSEECGTNFASQFFL